MSEFYIRKTPLPIEVELYAQKGGEVLFQPDNAYYTLPTPYSYPDKIVEQLVKEAREQTLRYSGIDDLDDVDFAPRWSSLYNLFRTTHAAEHLVVARLCEEGYSLSDKHVSGHTFFFRNLPVGARIGFVIDKRLATSSKIEESVQNVSRSIAAVL